MSYFVVWQTYLQSTIARLEEMRLKGQDIELWMAYHSLPSNLKKKIKKYERYKWRETKGVDVELLLHNLPRDLRRDTKRHLCSTPLKKVSSSSHLEIQHWAFLRKFTNLKPPAFNDAAFCIWHSFILLMFDNMWSRFQIFKTWTKS